MPYYKRRNYRRRNKQPGKPKQTQVNNMTAVKKYAGWVPWLLRNALHVKRLINTEKKYFDTNQSTTTLDTTGAVYLLSGMAQGTDNNQRQGRSIKPMYITVKGAVYLQSAQMAQIRVIIAIDTETNATTPTLADIIDPANPLGQYNLSSSIGRFKVIFDRLFALDDQNYTQKTYVFTRSLYTRIFYEGVGNTVTAAGKNSIWMFVVSDQITNKQKLAQYTRIRFVDN